MTFKSFLCIFVFIFILSAIGCGQDPQPGQQAGAKPSPPAQEALPQPETPPPSSAKSTVWPFISEDAAAEALAKNPLTKNYLLIFDGSGSMGKSGCSGNERKIDVAKRAVVAWSKSVPADANLGLYAFHNNGLLTLPLAAGNRETFMETVNQIIAGGKTPLTGAIQYAYKTFSEQGRRQLGYGDYTIVVVTDGIANSIPDLEQSVDTVLAKSPINIYSIGFCIGDDHSLNQPGRTIYKAADNPEQLRKGLRDVLAESESFDEGTFSN
jgi:hypothetical protein